MADNYLERKMEEHRAAATRAPRKLTPAGCKPGQMIVPFPPQRIYVTGGAKGIGRAIVQAFAKAGCKVAFCDIDSAAGAATAQGCGAQFHPLDVTDTPALQRSLQHVIEHWGGLDVVVNNVGVGHFKPFLDTTPADLREVLETNLMPIWTTSQALARYKADTGTKGGRIINISSTRQAMSEPGTEAYAASKGAISSLTHALMASLAPLEITVNAIAPGWIDTGAYPITEADKAFHPSGHVGIPADIARLCLFLASPQSQFINGECITVDGGVTRKMIYP